MTEHGKISSPHLGSSLLFTEMVDHDNIFMTLGVNIAIIAGELSWASKPGESEGAPRGEPARGFRADA